MNKSVAIKTKALASKALGADGVMMTGGVANNKGVVTELEKQLNTKIFISDKPEVAVVKVMLILRYYSSELRHSFFSLCVSIQNIERAK